MQVYSTRMSTSESLNLTLFINPVSINPNASLQSATKIERRVTLVSTLWLQFYMSTLRITRSRSQDKKLAMCKATDDEK